MTTYPKEKEEKYKEFFEKYSYPLHTFQKYSIEATVNGDHTLVTAHTGSGKTLCGEFAIEYFISKGKKVIYTTPLKALSNQKFYDFTQKYPHISFGILTGDLKCNPDADVLIMTAEILMNKLYSISTFKKGGAKANQDINQDSESFGSTFPKGGFEKGVSFDSTFPEGGFEMDIENELGCVVMDEVHFLNDASRGHVWEQTIMMLPEHISLVMLSATIDNPERFASWCETKGNTISSGSKQVLIASNYKRAVPLTHYSFVTVTNGIFKAIKDKTVHEEIKTQINRPFVIQSSEGVFSDTQFHKNQKLLKLFESKDISVKRAHVLNQVTKHLFDNNMLPALCFVFSRKQLEICAKEVTTVLLEDDSKVPYIIRRECEQIMRKLPNYQEYLQLPEYIELTNLLEKGIAIHHAGILAPLREMVELLYAKGYIKLLFATETMSTGINMPVKTVLFTSLDKYDGNQVRPMYAHEYTQAAGRAGRLGIDKVGHVIHLNNLFKNVELLTYKTTMNGKPQKLSSKFKLSFHLFLSLIEIGKNSFHDFLFFAKRSMIDLEIQGEIKEYEAQIEKTKQDIRRTESTIAQCNDVLEEYAKLLEDGKMAANKKKKEIDKRKEELMNENMNILKDFEVWKRLQERKTELVKLERSLENTNQYLQTQIQVLLRYMECEGFIVKIQEDVYGVTQRGKMAAQLKEIHSLVFGRILEKNILQKMSAKQLVAVFSCFTNVAVPDDLRALVPFSGDSQVNTVVKQIKEMYEVDLAFENDHCLDTGTNYDMHYDLLAFVLAWCECENSQQCNVLLKKAEKEKGIFLGEFVKALLKINNIAAEMEKIAEMFGEIEFLSHLKQIGEHTLKYVATNQSLYV
jgi:superfamily II RNA helicase